MNNNKVTKDFLFELGTEELPPKALKKLSKALLSSVENQLREAKIDFGATKWFASARRLSFTINNLAESQDDIVFKKQGPLVDIAYQDDKPNKIGLGFARSCGVEFEKLDIEKTPKGEKLLYQTIQNGQKTTKLLEKIITQGLKQLPVPKMMRWADLSVEFVRPVHWVLALYGNDVIDIEILTHKASNLTYGHRFHHPNPLNVDSPSSYVKTLAKAVVVVEWDQRKQMIIDQIKTIAKKNKYQVLLDNDLVEEICSIVEYPNAVLCKFNKEFLSVPREVLISSMKKHQKCFALLDDQGKLVSSFITISNIKGKNLELIKAGNQKVMNARLADAAFFYNEGLKSSLESLLPKLENVIFQHKLGSMYQKAQRIARISQQLGQLIGIDHQQAYRAGLLAKADLISDMVSEFTDLQGIIGKYYAKAYGESKTIADAIEQQYWPKPSKELPNTDTAACVALAEKIDTLVGIFGINQKPSGNKDPFALRRAAIGILRILRDTNVNIALDKLIDITLTSYIEVSSLKFRVDTKQQVIAFCLDRLKNLYKDEGIYTDIFNSISNTKYDSIKDFAIRVTAVNNFTKTQKAQSLITSNKRVANIINKNTTIKPTSYDIDLAKTLANKHELALASNVEKITPDITTYIKNHQYTRALDLLSNLDVIIINFFENVMVMDENIEVRKNRIALLTKLHKLFVSVADISKL